MGTRKRPAPGASPLGQTDRASEPNLQDLTLNWQAPNTTHGAYPNPTFFGNQQNATGNTEANQLIRRGNQPMMPMQNFPNTGNGWKPPDTLQAVNEGWSAPHDDLDQRALAAKSDAESKRKQIPPFVQKLSR